jgi:putative transposase
MSITKIWADMGYQGQDIRVYIKEEYKVDLEIIKRPSSRLWVHKDTPIDQLSIRDGGFKIQAKRWIVERTFAWLNRYRRLSKEYE